MGYEVRSADGGVMSARMRLGRGASTVDFRLTKRRGRGERTLSFRRVDYLVCMAVYMASGGSDLASKMAAIWFPISAFVALGFEHCVANMFMIPLGMARGADVTVGAMVWRNLVPVTIIGNVVGAVLIVTMPFWAAFGVDGAAAKESRDREMTGRPETCKRAPHVPLSRAGGRRRWVGSPETSKFN